MGAPDSTSSSPLRRIVSEGLVTAGGGRALLLQIAHPSIGRGVVEHSDFATRVMDRFHATTMFVCAAVFASDEEIDTVLRRVNRAHGPVRGAPSGSAPAYSAFDPQLQLWVSATLFQTMMDLHGRVFGPSSPEVSAAAYDEFRRLRLNLQVRPERWPETLADFDAYWRDMVAGLRVSEPTLAVSRQILFPRNVPLWLRAVLPDARLVTAGLLPPSVRDQFQLPWDERLASRFDRRMRLAATVYPRLPARLRHGTRDAYLRRLRRSIAEERMSAPVRPADPAEG